MEQFDAVLLRSDFLDRASDHGSKFTVLVTATRLPTGAVEISTNHMALEEKIKYIIGAYDSQFRLITNPKVQIEAFILI